MRNKNYKQIMDQLSPDEKTKERMLNQIMDQKENKNSALKVGPGKTLVLVALLAVVLVAMISLGTKSGNKVVYQGSGLKVTAIGKAPEVQGNPSSITAIFTEDEVFTFFPIAAFKGQVLAVQNIAMEDEFGKTYSSYVVLQIMASYQGDLIKGDEIKVLLPGPVEDGQIMGADFNITRAFNVGEEGIFLPVVNDDSSTALYGFTKYTLIDTTRFAFMMTEDGLDFNKETFFGLKEAKTLDDVEDYIKGKLVQ